MSEMGEKEDNDSSPLKVDTDGFAQAFQVQFHKHHLAEKTRGKNN